MQGDEQRKYGRRGFLVLVAGGLSSLAWAGPVSRLISPLTSAGSQLVGNLLPVGGWRIYTISGTMPLFDSSSWRLEIDGLVKHLRSLSYDELKTLPKAEQISTFHCVTGWTVNNVHWGASAFSTCSISCNRCRRRPPCVSSRSSARTRIRSRSSNSASPTRCSPTS